MRIVGQIDWEAMVPAAGSVHLINRRLGEEKRTVDGVAEQIASESQTRPTERVPDTPRLCFLSP